jgi:hypothetical protein
VPAPELDKPDQVVAPARTRPENARPPERDTADIAPRLLHQIRPDQDARRETQFCGKFFAPVHKSNAPRRAPEPRGDRSPHRSGGAHGNCFGNCELNLGATAEGCRHAPSDISRRRPLQTLRFGRRPLVNRSGQRNGCRRPTRWFRLRHRDPFGSLSAQRTKRYASQMARHDSRKLAGESGIRRQLGLVSKSVRAGWSP